MNGINWTREKFEPTLRRVLEIRPIESAETAVKVQIVKDAKGLKQK
jgi:hypothetical protein